MLVGSVQETRDCGASLARKASPGDVFALQGDLGTGKTEFVRGFMAELLPDAPVRSPSFAIVNTYETPRFPVYHFDFYRLGGYDELIEIGFDEYLSGEGVCIVEWADLFPDALPKTTRWISFEDRGGDLREITL